MAAPPNAFSDDLARWIYNEFRGSIVFVNMKPRSKKTVKDTWDKNAPIPNEDHQGKMFREKDAKHGLNATGFIIRDAEGYIWVLTCAHVLGHVFNAEKPITPAQVGKLFQPRVLCDHGEIRYRAGEDHDRVFVDANVVQIHCGMDLMLLSIPGEGFANYCDQPHRVLSIAPEYPPSLQRVAMLSWPPERHRTAVTGRTCHRGLLFDTVSCTNPYGFSMRLAEVDITSELGSSGAPLLNGAGQYAGVLLWRMRHWLLILN